MKVRYGLITLLMTSIAVANAHEVNPPASLDEFTFEQISEHIYVIHGSQILPNKRTRGFMNNPAIVISKKGVIVIDPGSSKEIGVQLIDKIKTVTDKPVIAVFNTHIHGDHWLGNHGIRSIYPEVPIYAHERMIERAIAGEGVAYNDIMLKLTEHATAGTKIIAPNVGLQGGEQLSFHDINLRIYHTGHAHTDSDIMIEVVNDKSLFFGDIVANKRVPNSDVPKDANFAGTIKAIDTILTKSPATLYIPGHGKSGGREIPMASLRFLKQLNQSVTTYYDQGLADYEMKDKVIADLSAFKDWNNFQEMGRVISHLYLEVESTRF